MNTAFAETKVRKRKRFGASFFLPFVDRNGTRSTLRAPVHILA